MVLKVLFATVANAQRKKKLIRTFSLTLFFDGKVTRPVSIDFGDASHQRSVHLSNAHACFRTSSTFRSATPCDVVSCSWHTDQAGQTIP